MAKLTLDQFVNQWVTRGSTRPIVSRFEYNIFDFTTVAGYYSKRFFRNSFNTGGFYRSGTKWAPRQSKWGKRFDHRLMFDTGKLRNGIDIDGTPELISIDGSRNSGTKIFRRGAKYNISTHEVSMPSTESPKKRTKPRKKKYVDYAAIHNSDPQLSGYTVNQHSNKPVTRRQFMGYSDSLDDSIDRLIPMIFKGIPNA